MKVSISIFLWAFCRTSSLRKALRRRLVALHEKYPAMRLDSLYHLLKPEFLCQAKRFNLTYYKQQSYNLQ